MRFCIFAFGALGTLSGCGPALTLPEVDYVAIPMTYEVNRLTAEKCLFVGVAQTDAQIALFKANVVATIVTGGSFYGKALRCPPAVVESLRLRGKDTSP